MKAINLSAYLEEQHLYFQQHFDVQSDPISIPKQFTLKQDIEISGFLAATISWGNRKAILKASNRLMQLMDHAPFQFVTQHSEQDLKALTIFYYRTFNSTDLLYFIAFLKMHYSKYTSLEDAFLYPNSSIENFSMYESLGAFYTYFFSLPYVSERSRKHIGNVRKQSACKRLNMYLRWMVRHDAIDFGLWKRIPKSALICPLDIHVHRVASSLGLLERKQSDWKAAQQLTERLRALDASDPVKYDLALFSLGVEGRLGPSI